MNKDRAGCLLFSLLVALSLSACPLKAPDWLFQPPHQNGGDLAFETIEQAVAPDTGNYYEAGAPAVVVVAEREGSDAIGQWISPDTAAQLRALDFDDYFALAVFQGRKPTTDYEVQVARIVRHDETLYVYAQFLEPRPDEETGQEETSPYHLIRVRKTGAWGQPITFELVVDDVIAASTTHVIP